MSASLAVKGLPKAGYVRWDAWWDEVGGRRGLLALSHSYFCPELETV